LPCEAFANEGCLNGTPLRFSSILLLS
jgi:hypothetical protein